MTPYSFSSIIIGQTVVTASGNNLYLNGASLTGSLDPNIISGASGALQTQLNTAVFITGNQTISGIKNFTRASGTFYGNGANLTGVGAGAPTWGNISGALSNQTDLSTALNSKGFTFEHSSSFSTAQFTTDNSSPASVTSITYYWYGQMFPIGGGYTLLIQDLNSNFAIFTISSISSNTLTVTYSSSSGLTFADGIFYTFNILCPAIPANGLLKTDANGNLLTAVANTDYQVGAGSAGVSTSSTISFSLGGNITIVNGIITSFTPAT